MANSKEEVCSEVEKQIETATQTTFIDVKSAMEASNKVQVEVIRSKLSATQTESENRKELESTKADLESALATL